MWLKAWAEVEMSKTLAVLNAVGGLAGLAFILVGVLTGSSAFLELGLVLVLVVVPLSYWEARVFRRNREQYLSARADITQRLSEEKKKP